MYGGECTECDIVPFVFTCAIIVLVVGILQLKALKRGSVVFSSLFKTAVVTMQVGLCIIPVLTFSASLCPYYITYFKRSPPHY